LPPIVKPAQFSWRPTTHCFMLVRLAPEIGFAAAGNGEKPGTKEA
jgi:hypothetical protein